MSRITNRRPSFWSRIAAVGLMLVTGGAILAMPQAAFATSSQDAFIASSVGPAQTTHAQYDIPASVTIGQAALESAWGASGLSADDNNFFGFKCVSSNDPGPIATGCHSYHTTECTPGCHDVIAWFRVYASRTDSFRDYGRLLTTSSAYASALPFRHNANKFIEAIAPHYATDPNYASKVESIMSAHDLYQYDSTLPQSSGAAVFEGGQFHVFGITDGAGDLYQDVWNGSVWSGWGSLGGIVNGAPAVTYHNGRFDVFATAPGGAMYQKTYSGGQWGAWHSIGGTFGLDTGAAAIYENGTYHVFGLSPAGTLYQNTWNGSVWAGWQSLGGTLQGTPAVTYHDGRFDVFGSAIDGAMFQRTYSGGQWDAWHSIGGSFATGTGTGAVYEGGHYHVFGIGSNGALFEDSWSGSSWSGWSSIGGNITGTPAVTYANGRFDVFALVSSGAMYQITGNSSWGAWHSIGGNFN